MLNNCRAPEGEYWPLVDRHKCEGKRDCVAVRPEQVFEVRRIDDEDFAVLTFMAS